MDSNLDIHQNTYNKCIASVTQAIAMSTQTMALNVRITKAQHDMLEVLVARGGYTSKSEFIRELLRKEFDDFAQYLHEKALRDRKNHVSLEEFGRLRGVD